MQQLYNYPTEWFHLVAVSLNTASQGARARLHCSSYPALLLPRLGAVEMWLDGQRHILQDGHMAYAPAEVLVDWWASGGDAELCVLEFERYTLASHNTSRFAYSADRHELPRNTRLKSSLPDEAGAWLARLLNPLRGGAGEADQFTADGAAVLRQLVLTVLDGAEAVPGKVSRQDFTIRETLDRMHRAYAAPLTSAGMAEATGYHPGYFSSQFRAQTGWTFMDYLTRIRVDKAKEWLLISDEPLQQIAHRVGYADGMYLSRKFSRTTGVSPSEFRRKPRPRRIAAFQFVGTLLALGITPVAALSETIQFSQLLQPELARVVPLELNERIVAELDRLQPDCVVIPTYLYGNRELVTELEQRMSVLAVDWDALDRLEEVRHFGAMLGLEREAEQWMQTFRQKCEQARSQLKASGAIKPGETAAVYEWWRDSGIYIWNSTARAASNLYQRLGLAPPDTVRQDVLNPGRHLLVALDRLSEYAADHMFIVATECNGNLAELRHLLREHPQWSELPAVRKQQVYLLRTEDFRFSEGIGLERQLDIQLNCLLGGKK